MNKYELAIAYDNLSMWLCFMKLSILPENE